MPSITSIFAMPRSASIMRTEGWLFASATARLTDTLVLPTPPLPLATASTRTCEVPLAALINCLSVRIISGRLVNGHCSSRNFLQLLLLFVAADYFCEQQLWLGDMDIFRHFL